MDEFTALLEGEADRLSQVATSLSSRQVAPTQADAAQSPPNTTVNETTPTPKAAASTRKTIQKTVGHPEKRCSFCDSAMAEPRKMYCRDDGRVVDVYKFNLRQQLKRDPGNADLQNMWARYMLAHPPSTRQAAAAFRVDLASFKRFVFEEDIAAGRRSNAFFSSSSSQ